jgi:hypothetical protein
MTRPQCDTPLVFQLHFFFYISNKINGWCVERAWKLNEGWFLFMSSFQSNFYHNKWWFQRHKKMGSFGQFFINKTRRSKFFAPSQHQHRPMRIPTIEKTLFVLIWFLGIPKIVLVKYAFVENLSFMLWPPKKGVFCFFQWHIECAKTQQFPSNLHFHT